MSRPILELDWDPDPPAPAIRLRGRQQEWVDAVQRDFETYSRVLVVAAGGTGKTTVFGALAAIFVARGLKVLVLENRDRLTRQTADRITKETGIQVDVEMADEHASPFAPVVVACVQSLSRENRLTGFADDQFGLIVADETHLGLAPSWLRIMRYFHYGSQSLAEGWVVPEDGTYEPKCKIAGFTASPDIGERRNLGELYQIRSIDYSYLQAVQDGWLVGPVQKNIPVKVDLRKFKAGSTPLGVDFKAQDVSAALVPVIEELAAQVVEHAHDKKTMAFLPSVECARMLSESLERRGMMSVFVSGECLDGDEKTERFVASGPGSVLTMAQIYCLDSETEILTDDGWVGMNEMTMQHRVANWVAEGLTFFAPPKNIARRPLYGDEFMVSVDSKIINFRVTNTHSMAVRCGGGRWDTKRKIAGEVTNRMSAPTCGVAAPLPLFVADEVKPATRARRITASAYAIRQRGGYGYDESIVEAARREDVRGALRYRQPHELTIDECRFIGFWIADGSVSKAKTCATVYSAFQSTSYPHIIRWFDGIIKRIGIDARKTFIPENNGFQGWQWVFSNGTGGGPQQRNGLYHLKPYLNKYGTKLLWALNEQQFDALVEGYWYGDGFHGQAEHGMGRSVAFQDTKKPWIELLCSIGPVRGWRCHMVPRPTTRPRCLDQWYLRMIKGADACLSSSTVVKHEPWSPEVVWCVETDSGYIITRRGGHVIVTGNSYGIDFPDVNCIAWFRATLSRAFYIQGIFRGTRVLPGVLDGLDTAEERRDAIARSAKPILTILDPLFVSDRIDLLDAYDLFTSKPEVKAAMKAAGELTPEAAQKGERDFLAALAKEARKHARKQSRTIDPLKWALDISDTAITNYAPVTAADSRPPSLGQITFFQKNHIDYSRITSAGLASKIIGRYLARLSHGLASAQQLTLLKQLGLPEDQCASITRNDASATIDRILREKREG